MFDRFVVFNGNYLVCGFGFSAHGYLFFVGCDFGVAGGQWRFHSAGVFDSFFSRLFTGYCFLN